MRTRYGVLGPLEVWQGERLLPIGGPQQKALLAILLMNANKVVSTDRLVEYLWGPRPPSTARSLLQGCISQLRRALRPDGASVVEHPLATRPPGYAFRVEEGQLDLLVFEQLVRTAAGVADAARRTQLFADALRCWRGPVLDGLDLPACREQIAQLDERRVYAVEQKIEADLAQGARVDMIGELKMEIRRQPLRERLWGVLMATLYALDRQAEALAAYRDLRVCLIEQLGIEPGPTLQELHRQVLVGASVDDLVIPVGRRPAGRLLPSPPAAHPAQLPAAPTTFVGRRRHLERLNDLLVDASITMALAVVSGTAGVGKTALTLYWAHQVKEQFPAGQLYVDLRGYGLSSRLRPIEAVAGFLSALGVSPERIPVELDHAAALYRSLVAGQRFLILLDNAYDAAQVRPLLPATPGCLVLVNGRGRLDGLVARDGGQLMTLDVLDAAEATALLTRVVGEVRVEAEPEAVVELVRLCARLPLALQITGANLIRRPQRRLADQVKELRTGELDALVIDDEGQSAVRAVFAQSYGALEPEARRMFSLLGLVPGPGFDAAAAAALAEVPLPLARTSLNRLVGSHLLDETEPDRFAFHELLRLYAREQAHLNHDTLERNLAHQRYIRWMFEMADAATRLLCPQLLRIPSDSRSPERHQDPAAALAWLNTERLNLVAIATVPTSGDDRAMAWMVADALRGYFWLRRHRVDWLAVASAGLAAAEAEGDLQAQAAAEFSLGMAKLCLNEHAEAMEHQSRALQLCEAAEWEEGCANALGNLGVLHFEIGEIETGLELHEQALMLNRRTGSQRGEAVNRENLAQVHLAAGRLREAGRHLWRALVLHHQTDYASGSTLEQLGILFGRRAEHCHAVNALRRAFDQYRTIGNVNGQAMTLAALAVVRTQSGSADEGLEEAQRAYELVQETGDRVTEACVLIRLASVQMDLGRYAEAAENHSEALSLATQTGARMPQTEALLGLSDVHLALGEPIQSRSYAKQALLLADNIGYQGLYGQALAQIAAVHRDLGDGIESAKHARRAYAVGMETGDELLRRRALGLLGSLEDTALPPE
ncbi:AfsR/SARP family transcriptional regulator [Kribbella albertanoniae]|uniref:Tetratricopeptide repeat protein n=1 Tax=Kribbella albertanoniae TaxID=1266829 RepID=A0A4R4QGD7_9ACTN|nr:BTAD domain-containing putative transcriptional regulator [Kribbella albertanoniae]TDC34667.1 tetratricopeptide repeat protein [Kribbella albertanoniae]